MAQYGQGYPDAEKQPIQTPPLAYGGAPPPMMQQPMATQPMAVGGGGNRNVKNLPFDANGQREWSNGICGCFGDVGTCLISWWCPCLVYSQNKSRVEYLEQNGRPHPDGGDMCGTDCCCYACLLYFGCGWVLQMGNRAAVRTRYRIAGNGATDCLAAACCTPCELVQESQELELEERSLMQ